MECYHCPDEGRCHCCGSPQGEEREMLLQEMEEQIHCTKYHQTNMTADLRKKLDARLREGRADAREEYKLLLLIFPRQQRKILSAYKRNRRNGHPPWVAMFHVYGDLRYSA